VHIARKPTVSAGSSSLKEPSSEDSPRVGELVSAISKVDISTAMYAGKAFLIATGIVAVGGLTLSLGVKALMGVEDVGGIHLKIIAHLNFPAAF
jgi:hypothetical protein